MSCSVRQPLIDIFISRQMEHEKGKNFNSMVQDTVYRLQHCMQLLDKPITINEAPVIADEYADESTENAQSSFDVDAIKKRAKKAKRNARKKEQRTEDENVNPDESDSNSFIKIDSYVDESQIGVIMELIGKELSEPYSIYTYRYFLNTWPELTLLAYNTRIEKYVGVVVCKIDAVNESSKSQNTDEDLPCKGYIAMLAVDEGHRGLGIGTKLVEKVITRMHNIGCDEIILETEISNTKALNLYSRLGFIRERRLYRYYLNGSDAFRLVNSSSSTAYRL